MTSVPQKSIPSAVVIHYGAWYTFPRNRHYWSQKDGLSQKLRLLKREEVCHLAQLALPIVYNSPIYTSILHVQNPPCENYFQFECPVWNLLSKKKTKAVLSQKLRLLKREESLAFGPDWGCQQCTTVQSTPPSSISRTILVKSIFSLNVRSKI